MNPAYPGLAAAAFYLAGTYFQFGTLKQKASSTSPRLFVVAALAALLHLVTEYGVVGSVDGIRLGVLSVASLIALTLVVFQLIASIWQPLQNLFVIVFPLAAVAVLASLFGHEVVTPRTQFGEGLLAHILVSIVAYTILAMAAVQSILLALQERSLRHKTITGFVTLLPPLQTMETMLFQLLWVGLIALTLAIGSGFLYLTDMFAQSVVPHTILASASWVTFAILLAGRYLFGWRSTLATRATLVGFVLLILAYFVTRFVLEILLGTV